MLKRLTRLITLPFFALTVNVGCAGHHAHIERAIAVLSPTEGNDTSGVVEFTKTAEGVRVTAEARGLTPGDHGFHVHQWGDITAGDGTATGGHFDPHGTMHGARDADMKHIGDLGNLTANSRGVATYDWTDPRMTLEMIIGRAVIVHADPDDYGQPTGNAGARVAQGVIGVAEPRQKMH